MASRSINKVVLLGNLTRDPELKYTPAGTAVCTFGVATNRTWTTADGQTKEDVQYHKIVAWQKLAELCGKLLTKGRKIYLEGRLTYRTFTGKDNVQRTVTEIVMDDFIVFSDGRRPGAENTAAEKPAKEEATNNIGEDFPDVKAEDKSEGGKTSGEMSTGDESVNPDDIPF